MNIVSVDLCTLSAGDINFSALEKLGRVTYYDTLTPGGLAGAAASACFAALIAAGQRPLNKRRPPSPEG